MRASTLFAEAEKNAKFIENERRGASSASALEGFFILLVSVRVETGAGQRPAFPPSRLRLMRRRCSII